MNPILFILLLIVGGAFLWIASVWILWEGNLLDSAPLWAPFAVVGVTILTAAGLGIGGVLT